MLERAALFVALMLIVALGALADGDTPAPEFPWDKYGLTPSGNPACISALRGEWWPTYHENMLVREPHETARLPECSTANIASHLRRVREVYQELAG